MFADKPVQLESNLFVQHEVVDLLAGIKVLQHVTGGRLDIQRAAHDTFTGHNTHGLVGLGLGERGRGQVRVHLGDLQAWGLGRSGYLRLSGSGHLRLGGDGYLGRLYRFGIGDGGVLLHLHPAGCLAVTLAELLNGQGDGGDILAGGFG